MIKRSILNIILVLFVILCCTVSGCVNNHKTEIKQAKSLVESANSRMSVLNSVNFTKVYVGEIRANASAAKSDLTEAKKILEKIPQNEITSQDKADLIALIQMLDATIELADIIEGPIADFIEDAQTIINSKDPTTVSDAAIKLKQDLEIIKTRVNKLSDEYNSIDDAGLSPKMKGELIYTKTLIKSFLTDIDKISVQLENTCIKKCPEKEVLGTDCQCHPRCGLSYCSQEAICCKNVCYISPGPFYQINMETCYFQKSNFLLY